MVKRLFLDKYGWPVERIKGRKFTNLIRLILHTRKIKRAVSFKLIIWAGDYKQAENYARSKGLKRREFVYLSDEYKILGIREGTIVKVGTWYERKDIRVDYIEAHATSHNITIKEAK